MCRSQAVGPIPRRCFSLIENSSLENPTRLDRDTDKMNTEENILEVGLASTFSSILAQCSPDIFKAGGSLREPGLFSPALSQRFVANSVLVESTASPRFHLQALHFATSLLYPLLFRPKTLDLGIAAGHGWHWWQFSEVWTSVVARMEMQMSVQL